MPHCHRETKPPRRIIDIWTKAKERNKRILTILFWFLHGISYHRRRCTYYEQGARSASFRWNSAYEHYSKAELRNHFSATSYRSSLESMRERAFANSVTVLLRSVSDPSEKCRPPSLKFSHFIASPLRLLRTVLGLRLFTGSKYNFNNGSQYGKFG